jgi:hypothetical protein
MISKAIAFLMAGGLAFSVLCKNAPRIAAIPNDPLEIVASQVQVAKTPATRIAALQLLDRARSSYALRNSSLGYDLRVTFSVNSGGVTEYDGAWEMQDVSDPRQGLRWTAQTSAGYKITQISASGMSYSDGTASNIPLRLQEARAALFGAIPSTQNAERALIRTAAASFNGVELACVLISHAGSAVAQNAARSWEETEECIDPKSGLLRVHSQVPGRYYAYDYTNAPTLDGFVLPRKVTVTEGGSTVSEISIASLTALPSVDPSLFVPTPEMMAKGPAIVLGEAQKISRFAGPGPFTSRTTVQPVCVFGLVTPAGQLVELHSLQPQNPNSQAAIEDVKKLDFSRPPEPGARPQQHFVFVIEKFAK